VHLVLRLHRQLPQDEVRVRGELAVVRRLNLDVGDEPPRERGLGVYLITALAGR
jgi:hypothetical protein